MKEYSVTKQGREYAIFSATTRAYVLYGKKKEIERRCKELNDEESKCEVCSQHNTHHSLCPNNIINSDSFQYKTIQQ